MRRAMRWQLARVPKHVSVTSRFSSRALVQARTLSGLIANIPTIAAILERSVAPEAEIRDLSVAGSVRTIRKQKRHAFAEIGDGSTSRSLQAILEPSQAEG